MPKLKQLTIPNVGKGIVQRELQYFAGENVKL